MPGRPGPFFNLTMDSCFRNLNSKVLALKRFFFWCWSFRHPSLSHQFSLPFFPLILTHISHHCHRNSILCHSFSHQPSPPFSAVFINKCISQMLKISKTFWRLKIRFGLSHGKQRSEQVFLFCVCFFCWHVLATVLGCATVFIFLELRSNFRTTLLSVPACKSNMCVHVCAAWHTANELTSLPHLSRCRSLSPSLEKN